MIILENSKNINGAGVLGFTLILQSRGLMFPASLKTGQKQKRKAWKNSLKIK